jgi:uncharacterized protein (TIGR03086 family)
MEPDLAPSPDAAPAPDLDLLGLAGRRFADSVVSVPADAWATPSVCDGWTVRDLVLHVVGGCHMAVALLAGADREAALAAKDAPVTADPATAVATALVAEAAAFAAPAVADRVVHHPALDMTGAQLLDQRIVELSVHGWDLARSLGGDAAIDERLAEAAWAMMEPLAPLAAAIGVYGAGPTGTLGDDASAEVRLLDVTGRTHLL